MIGERFGTRTVVEEMAERRNGAKVYKVVCDCGSISVLKKDYIKKNKPCRSCSAVKNVARGKEHHAYLHGNFCNMIKNNPEYESFISLI